MIDVLIIGAGPAGSVAAALLVQRGFKVLVLEKQKFPRFSVGESLLAQTLGLIDEAGMLDAVLSAGFQYKNGEDLTAKLYSAYWLPRTNTQGAAASRGLAGVKKSACQASKP